MNKKKSSYEGQKNGDEGQKNGDEGQKNGDEGQNDAQVLKTYSFDTMTQNMGWKIISSLFIKLTIHTVYIGDYKRRNRRLTYS